MLKCPKCVAELTQPITGDSTTCPGCGLIVHVSTLSPQANASGSVHAPTQSLESGGIAASAVMIAVPKKLGRYEIIELLGSGGFAMVYLARDTQLDRRVALKVPRGERFAGNADLKALYEEARIVARLEHPGFVSVYDVALDESGLPFLVMQYLPGKTLRDRLQGNRLSFRETAQLIRKVAATIHYAHKQRLYHRDLKPSNILFSSVGEPFIADLGLAVTERSQLSRAGEFAGTLPYMAPEQVRGETHRLDGRCDIWSIGVMMYEMLTGNRPFRGESTQVGDEIQHREPRPLRQINEQIPPELEQICLKCLRKSLTDRYLSAFDLAADLDAWLRGNDDLATGGDGNSRKALEAPAADSARLVKPVDGAKSFATRNLWIIALLVLVGGAAVLRLGGFLPSSSADSTQDSHPVQPVGGTGSGSGTATDVTPDEAPSVDEWAPRRWHDLLEYPPKKLAWGDWPTAQLGHDAGRRSISVDTPDMGLLTLGETTSGDFRLQIAISKSAWVGSIGLFWGYQDASPDEGRTSPECHVIWLQNVDSEGIGVLRLDRERWKFNKVPKIARPLVGKMAIATQRVQPPKLGTEGILELTVFRGELLSAQWCGQEIVAMKKSEPPIPSAPLSCVGKFGVVAANGAVVVSDARIMLTREMGARDAQ